MNATIWYQEIGPARFAGHCISGNVQHTSEGQPTPTWANEAAMMGSVEPNPQGFAFTTGEWKPWAAWIDGGPKPE